MISCFINFQFETEVGMADTIHLTLSNGDQKKFGELNRLVNFVKKFHACGLHIQ